MKSYKIAAIVAVGLLAIGALALFEPSAALAADGYVPLALASFMAPAAHYRGASMVRAEDDPKKVFAELKQTVEAFKEAHQKELDELKKGVADVITKDKVDKINTDISALQKTLDDVNKALAAAQISSALPEGMTAEKKEHADAFNRFFRRGAEAGLADLQVKAGLSMDSNPDGGFLVPEQTEAAIDRVLGTVSVMRSRARVMRISAPVYKKLVNQGGTEAGWVSERQTRPETDTSRLSELVFNLMEIYANPAATQQLLDDARVDIAAWLADEVNIAFAEQEGAAFISGNGVGKPRGILSYTNVADANYAWGSLGYIASGVAGALSDTTHNGADALIDLVYSLKGGYRQNASFMMNRMTAKTVRKLKDSDGRYLWQESIQQNQPASLLGYGVDDDDNMPDISANAVPIAFGDFMRGYLIVDGIGVRVLRDPYTNKPHVQFYTTKRVGGGVQNYEAIKLFKIAAS